MATDAQTQGFVDGRANLRAIAKWLMSGLAATAAAIVGTSAFSNLGSLPDHFWRLVIALPALLTAGWLWLELFNRTIRILKTEVVTLRMFASAESGELKAAADQVSALLKGQLQHPVTKASLTMREFVDQREALRDAAWRAKANEEAKRDAVAALDQQFAICSEACMTELLAQRFKEAKIQYFSVGILSALLVFVAAANTPKAEPKAPTAVTVTLSPETVRLLAASQGARVPAVATPPGAGAGAAPTQQPPSPAYLVPGAAAFFVGLMVFFGARRWARRLQDG
jgi:hypothetical protein